MAATARQQPPWQAPPASTSAITGPDISIHNSLTKSKTPFRPLDPAGRKVSWYACGPTVYDDSHLGHARNYVTTDIIRRIMRDYFKFDLMFVMNITDVDDKIILRGRQQYLLANFKAQNKNVEDVKPEALKAYRAYLSKYAPELQPDLDPSGYNAAAEKAYGGVLAGQSLAGDGSPPGDKEAKLKMHLRTLGSASDALSRKPSDELSLDDFFNKTEDVLLTFLDSLHGSSINAEDHSIFTKLTQRYESRFMEDMRALNCLDPDTVTRVTEYGPQIVEFVERVIDNGFAYTTSDGSVYFDIEAFEKAGYPYARLEPWNRNDKDLQADGEGSLTAKTTEKRSDADFALWKSSKPGEPSWPSPWGPGRPGWHIECSAMASDKLGKTLDIHSGGIDLAFPHHDNELAQSEAYWGQGGHGHSHQWVNYFMHMGHLSIQGSKMSKSLKNFTTIREALGNGAWTPRGLRIVFLSGNWKDPIEITSDLVKYAENWEDKVNNFFLKAKTAQESQAKAPDGVANGDAKAIAKDDEVLRALSKAQSQTHEALCDSFNTPVVMQTISEFISEYNSAVSVQGAITVETTLVAADWVKSVVNIFGLDSNPTQTTVGWSGLNIPAAAEPFVYPASKLRDEVRKRAKSGHLDPKELTVLSQETVAATTQPIDSIHYAEILSQFQEDIRNLAAKDAPAKEYLKICDELRDLKLWDQGIYLEDPKEEGQPALVRPLNRQLIQERREREQRQKDKELAKAKREQEQAAKAEKGKLSPLEMFRTDEFSAWDDEGMPTKDAQGEDVAKSRYKKLRKQWEAQKKAHDAWKAGQTG